MTTDQILEAVAAGNMDADAAKKALDALRPKGGLLSCKVSQKGAISVYGLQARFPVTLYVEQWERLIAFADEIKAFAKENDSDLTRKAKK